MKKITLFVLFLIFQSSFAQEKDSCVFNNNYKQLTTEWLHKLGKTNFEWNTKKKQAILKWNDDIVFVSVGGCTHFTTSVLLQLQNDTHKLNDTAYWVKKAINLSKELRLNHYHKMLKTNRFKIVKSKENVIILDIADDNINDNLFYQGVEINFKKDKKTISFVKYYN